MKKILAIFLIIVFYFIEIGVFNFSYSSFFITFSPIIFFYFLSISPLLAINVTLIYALGLDAASGHKVPINILSVLFMFTIYYLSHKKGVDFKYEKNCFLFCCLYSIFRITFISYFPLAYFSFYQTILAVIVNLVFVCMGFFLLSFIIKKVSRL